MTQLLKVLVTAKNGQVGYCLTERLKTRADVQLFSFDRTELDITNKQQVEKAFNETQPDIIINAAAYTAVDEAENDIANAFAINETGPKYLADMAVQFEAILLHISTDYVFDGSKDSPYLETDTPSPQSVYGKSKLAGEQGIISSDCKHVILRTAWVFGEHGNNFVKTMLRLGAARDTLGVIGDQFGGPTYAGDIADALIAIMDNYQCEAQNGIYHFSGAPQVSWYQFATSIFENAKHHDLVLKELTINEIPATAYPLPAPRPANSRLNCEKVETVFGIRPSNWQQALENIMAYK
ncbi:dTDP-4-dehydrorhamnose reductase [Vibrio clamense]|uniref:dTDP-4-dehydrorhamnose reductase n=1 Tax=Vibrio clamense TaxID=2910254 RepID=UPI003D1DF1C3